MPVHALGVACRWLVGLVALAAAASSAHAQSAGPAPAPSAASGAPAVERTAPAEYQIGPGDVLSIKVANLSDFDQRARVSNSGRIHVPYLGVLTVVDRSTSQLEEEIAALLRAKQLVNEPWVQVRVVQYRAQPVYILGEVLTPGQFLITDEMYLTDLITLGNGFNEVASPVGYLYRRKHTALGQDPVDTVDGEHPSEEAVPIDFKELNEGLKPELNVRLRGGDVLYVPQRRRTFFFVVGDVTVPGLIEIPAGQTVLLTQAIGAAGGPLRTAKVKGMLLVRTDATGARQELPVDFDAILRGRKPEIEIQPNDIIFIPGSSAKTVGYGLLGIIPGIAQGRLLIR